MDPSLSRRRLQTWIRLLRLTRTTESRLRVFLRVSHQSTLPRFDVMAALQRAKDPLKMSELSSFLLTSNGNASTVVDRLEKDGLAIRFADAVDRRVVKVRLTDRGQETFAALAAGHEALVNELFSSLGDEDMDHLGDLLHRAEGPQRALSIVD